jgi:hypothetical protein
MSGLLCAVCNNEDWMAIHTSLSDCPGCYAPYEHTNFHKFVEAKPLEFSIQELDLIALALRAELGCEQWVNEGSNQAKRLRSLLNKIQGEA